MIKLKPWEIEFEGWDEKNEKVRETLLTIGNGYFASRGIPEEAFQNELFYPGTYFHGGYNRLSSKIESTNVNYEQIVNWPNWLYISFRIENELWFDLRQVEILEHTAIIKLKEGYVERRVYFRDSKARETVLISRRLIHMEYMHLGYIEWELTPVNWSSSITIRVGIDGTVVNSGESQYRALKGNNFQVINSGSLQNGLYLVSQSTHSKIILSQLQRIRINSIEKAKRIVGEFANEQAFIYEDYHLKAFHKTPIQVEKILTFYTSTDKDVDNALEKSIRISSIIPERDFIFKSQRSSWGKLWTKCDIEISDNDAQSILRFHIFHILQTISPNTSDLDTGISGRGLHGEGYLGHTFWDDLFILPFLNYRLPDIARSLLMYRFRRLSEAKCRASQLGHKGVLFPWRSGKTGTENTPFWHFNPLSQHWVPDDSNRQFHINLSIAYNIWNYFYVTEDYTFLEWYGAKMFFEIALFWSSISKYDSNLKRYTIRGVVGPDEFHTKYPFSDRIGIDDNAYTNVMAVWVLEKALKITEILPKKLGACILNELEIDKLEIELWNDKIRYMNIPFHEESIISQFANYEQLLEIDFEKYKKQHKNINRIDLILEKEGDDVNKYKVAKQADVLMLFYLLTLEELHELFTKLGYVFNSDILLKNIDYYSRRTTNGSTLSHVVQSWVHSRVDRSASWKHFNDALQSDIGNIQGSTGEGIHIGAMGGTLDLVQRCYGGLSIRGDHLWINPRLPVELDKLSMKLNFRGNSLLYSVDKNSTVIQFEKIFKGVSEKIYYKGKIIPIIVGKEMRLSAK